MNRIGIALTLLFALLHCWHFLEVECNVHRHDRHGRDSEDSAKITIDSENRQQFRDQRTLYRKSGGHLMLSPLSTEASSTSNRHEIRIQSTTTSTTEASTTSSTRKLNSEIKNHKSYFRRKVKTIPTRNGSTNSSSSAISDNLNSKDHSNEPNDDENNLDYGLMTMSAAGDGVKGGKSEEEELSKASSGNGKKEEKQKTLADQIAEGKYGLIEKELFTKMPVRPGIISYKTNPETPQDNEKSLGGLKKDEIWLAEDHLLVLKGGIPNEGNSNEDWKPIDDYEAPKRPVKIPLNPRVPPPFPVKLSDNGPLEFVGHNQFSLFNPYTNETGLFANDPGQHNPHIPQTTHFNTKNPAAGHGPIKNPSKTPLHEVVQPPPWLFYNNKENDLLKQFPFNLPLPDAVLNGTEEFDEDDPSLFYPPPYSFIYKINYTNLAPVGPLVPGIILPPPPDFFSVYNPDEEKKPVKTPIDVINRIKEIHLKNRLTAPTATTSRTPLSTVGASSTVRDFTRKTKLTSVTPSSTVAPSTTRLHKAKSSTARPITTILQPTTTPRDDLKAKIASFDTTTLKLYPVYTPTNVPTGTTKLFSSSTTTTLSPPPALIKPYKQDYGTQTHPIYFEYFDARTANPIKGTFLGGAEYQGSYDGSAIYSPAVSSTLPPPPIYSSNHHTHHQQSKKPKSFYPPQFISSTISPHPAHVDTKFLFVTPKPEIFGTVIAQPQQYPVVTDSPSIAYNAVPVVQAAQKPLVLKPVRFEDEIAAIRHTLDYFNGKKKKAPKVKAVYEFSFEASKHKDDFQPMLSYDQQKYYTASTKQQQQQQQQHSHQPEINLAQLSELIKTNGYFPTTTETSMKYYRTKQSATLPPKKNSATTLTSETSATSSMPYGQKLRQSPQHQHQTHQSLKQQSPPQNTNVNYYVRPIYKEVVSSPQSQKIINYPTYESQQQQQPMDQGYRVNNRNTKYRKPQQQQNTQLQSQQQFYGTEIASLINDTAVNYKQPQRPINPFSEFIDVSRFPQNSQQNAPTQNSPPFYQPQLPIHAIYPNYGRPISQQYQQNPVNVIKVYPHVPQINPESVHITFYNRPLEKIEGSY